MSDEIEVFVNQPLQLRLNTYIDITSGVDSVKIAYQKPDGTSGEWAAIASTTYAVATIAGGVLDQQGQWYVHAYVKFTGATHYTPGAREGQYIRVLFER